MARKKDTKISVNIPDYFLRKWGKKGDDVFKTTIGEFSQKFIRYLEKDARKCKKYRFDIIVTTYIEEIDTSNEG